jgi:drug/metabolite transporter (DMT)-like permease
MPIALYFCIILSNVTQSASTKAFNQKNYAPVFFNVVKAASAFLITLLLSLSGFTFHLPTVIFGFCYGAALSVSMYAGYEALCRGPMALTSMLVSFSVMLPFIWGVTVRSEALNGFKIAALIILVAAIICTNLDKLRGGIEKPRDFGAWLAFVGITFLGNGVYSILQKEHQTLYPSMYNREFMVFALFLATVIYLLIFLSKKPITAPKRVKGKSFALLAGITTALSGTLTLSLAAMENASILFSILSAGGILASLACGRLVFREKLKLNHYAALLLGITSIILMKI